MEARILIVDDSDTLRQQLRTCLEGAGFDVEEASDGAAGESKAKKEPYDLLIVDLHMPKMDGLELIRRVRQLPTHHDTPMFLLTSEPRHGRVQEAKRAGANAWIVKPFDPASLLKGVRMVLNARIGRPSSPEDEEKS